MKGLIFVFFLFLTFEKSINESKNWNNPLSDHFENNTIYSYIKKGPSSLNYYSKDKAAKRLNDQKLTERNQLCSNLKNLKCINLPPECLNCKFNFTCVYGSRIETTCRPHKNYSCEGPNEFNKTYECAFCYQLPESNYTCTKASSCKPYSRYLTNCTVNKKVFCLGNRKFNKFIRCQIKSNVKWNYALIFSITLGGFGMDRFYLGNWQEGFGKLFSFGGLGFWTLIDVILIWVGYLK